LGQSQVYGFFVSAGGSVGVTSVEGKGTIFTLCLPRSRKTPVRKDAAEPVRGG